VRVLADTNVLIPLEDTSPLLDQAVAKFARLAGRHAWQLLVHPASFEDIERDKNVERRTSVMSKLAKYERLEHAPVPTPEFWHELGDPTKVNDICDGRILYAVRANAVGLLVTEDRNIHAKAKRLGLHKRVYYVTQALALIEELHGEKRPTPPAVKLLPMHAIPLSDPFFDSLRGEYDFDEWYSRKAQEGRNCWVVRKEDGGLAAMCIFNVEADPTPSLRGPWLKLCTFKVAPEMSGRKLGELLLKTAFGHCEANRIPGAFVTAFPKHEALVGVFAEFGFQNVESIRGELVLAKSFAPPLADLLLDDPLEYNTLYFPHYLAHQRVRKFVVPVIPKWHDTLFPEWTPQAALFPATEPVGNAIRKAYLCNASTNRVRAGDLLFFYRSQDQKAVTTIAVVEDTLRSEHVETIAAFVGKRTVYSVEEIGRMCADTTVLALIFRQCKHAMKMVPFKELRAKRILNNHVETITEIKHEGALTLLAEGGL